MTPLFIYSKDEEYRVLDMENWEEFTEIGEWKHVATIDPKLWIQNLINLPDKKIIKEIKSLRQ